MVEININPSALYSKEYGYSTSNNLQDFKYELVNCRGMRP